MDLEKKISENGEKPYYVVRGARISCDLGTACDVLNMPVSHGVFIKDKPQANVADSVVGKNIICTTVRRRLLRGTYLFGVCRKTGLPCVPKLQLQWINQSTTKLEVEEQKALLHDANTFCTEGGIIEILTTGQ